MKIAITGSSGLIGRSLTSSLLESGDNVLRIVRDRHAIGQGEAFWDPANHEFDPHPLSGVDGVVHLSGLGIAGRRWSGARKAALRASRIDSGKLLAETMASMDHPPSVVVSASAVGIYGNRGNEILGEESARGDGFLASLTSDWEAALEPANRNGTRVVHARLGVVVSKEGDFLRKLVPLFRLGLGGTIAGGRQWLSWIHINDAVKSIQFALRNPSLEGAFNAVAPNPVTNADFSKALGRVLRRPVIFKAPALAMRLALGQMGEETALFSVRAVPRRLKELGFEFDHPTMNEALRAEVASP